MTLVCVSPHLTTILAGYMECYLVLPSANYYNIALSSATYCYCLTCPDCVLAGVESGVPPEGLHLGDVGQRGRHAHCACSALSE